MRVRIYHLGVLVEQYELPANMNLQTDFGDSYRLLIEQDPPKPPTSVELERQQYEQGEGHEKAISTN